jgi:type IV pilus assembly protein PilA
MSTLARLTNFTSGGRMNSNGQRGFTLIELMIVVTIIAILATVAIPAYQDYLGKAQSEASVVTTDGLKLLVVQYTENEGACPNNETDDLPRYSIGKASSYVGVYVSSISLTGTLTSDGGCIVTTSFKDTGVHGGLRGKKVYMQLFGGDRMLFRWSCYTDVDPRYYSLLISSCGFPDHAAAVSHTYGLP